MKKMIYCIGLAICLSATKAVAAEPLDAELIMPGERTWKGQLTGRDGEWVEFLREDTDKPVRVGASTIQELILEVELDRDEVNKMNRNREYDRVIATLEKALIPFAEYRDIPSNLAFYNGLLMEMYYKIRNYKETLEFSIGILEDDRDPDLQEKARIFRALALIDTGRTAEAEALISSIGWDKDLNEDSAPQKLYIMAKLLFLKKECSKAMELVSYIVAFNSQDIEWIQPAELLCAEVYTDLGMLDSAEEVVRGIEMLYRDSLENDKAQLLKIKIEKLRAEQKIAAENELEGGSGSESN